MLNFVRHSIYKILFGKEGETMMAMLWAQKIMYAETKEEAIALYKSAAPSERQGRTDPDRKWMRRSDQRERRTVRRGRHGRSEGTV